MAPDQDLISTFLSSLDGDNDLQNYLNSLSDENTSNSVIVGLSGSGGLNLQRSGSINNESSIHLPASAPLSFSSNDINTSVVQGSSNHDDPVQLVGGSSDTSLSEPQTNLSLARQASDVQRSSNHDLVQLVGGSSDTSLSKPQTNISLARQASETFYQNPTNFTQSRKKLRLKSETYDYLQHQLQEQHNQNQLQKQLHQLHQLQSHNTQDQNQQQLNQLQHHNPQDQNQQLHQQHHNQNQQQQQQHWLQQQQLNQLQQHNPQDQNQRQQHHNHQNQLQQQQQHRNPKDQNQQQLNQIQLQHQQQEDQNQHFKLLQQKQQQYLQSLNPLQRAQRLQQLLLKKQLQRSGGAQPNAKGKYHLRLKQYLNHQQHRPSENSIEYWRRFVAEYFSPGAKKLMCFSHYDNIGHDTFDFSPHKAPWKCDHCGTKSGRGFEVHVDALPMLYEIKFTSGVIDELLYLDMPSERRFGSGVTMLEYRKAVQKSFYKHISVVREGHLSIVFSQDLKIMSWEFCTRRHEELIPRRLLAPHVNQLLHVVENCQRTIDQRGADGIHQQANIEMVMTVGCQIANILDLESHSLDVLGFSKPYVRFLKALSNSKDLNNFCHHQNVGPRRPPGIINVNKLVALPNSGINNTGSLLSTSEQVNYQTMLINGVSSTHQQHSCTSTSNIHCQSMANTNGGFGRQQQQQSVSGQNMNCNANRWEETEKIMDQTAPAQSKP